MTRELLEAAAAAAFRRRRLCVKENAPFPATVPKIWQANLSCENRSPGNTLQRDHQSIPRWRKDHQSVPSGLQNKNIKNKNKKLLDM